VITVRYAIGNSSCISDNNQDTDIKKKPTHQPVYTTTVGVYFARLHKCVQSFEVCGKQFNLSSLPIWKLPGIVDRSYNQRQSVRRFFLLLNCYNLFTQTDTINIGFPPQTSRSLFSSIQTKR